MDQNGGPPTSEAQRKLLGVEAENCFLPWKGLRSITGDFPSTHSTLGDGVRVRVTTDTRVRTCLRTFLPPRTDRNWQECKRGGQRQTPAKAKAMERQKRDNKFKSHSELFGQERPQLALPREQEPNPVLSSTPLHKTEAARARLSLSAAGSILVCQWSSNKWGSCSLS